MTNTPDLTPEIIYMVQNDTGPDRQFAITRAGYDFTGATAKFGIKSKLTGTVNNSAHDSCTVSNATVGSMTATYVFQTGDLPDPGGDYECDLEITVGGKDQTVYKKYIIRTRAEII